MFDRSTDKNSGPDQSNEGDIRAFQAFYREIQSITTQVGDIQDNLSSTYPERALSKLSLHFEQIGRSFANYTTEKSNILYRIIHRSNSRLGAVEKVAERAKNIARLFERYARDPKAYSAVHSRLEIHKLQSELKNLERIFAASSKGMYGDSTTDAPPPEGKKKKKGKGSKTQFL
jgi:hypothetical protein